MVLTEQWISCADWTLDGYERMRADSQWGAVIAGLEDDSWLAHKEQAAAAFKRELSILARTGTRLLASVARRLLACFSPLVGWLTSTSCKLQACVHVFLCDPCCNCDACVVCVQGSCLHVHKQTQPVEDAANLVCHVGLTDGLTHMSCSSVSYK